MFEDITENNIDILKKSDQDKINKRKLDQSIASVNETNEEIKKQDDILKKKKAEKEAEELAKDEADAMKKALQKKYNEEQKKREAYFKAQEEKLKDKEWKEQQEKHKSQKKNFSFGNVIGNMFPKSTGEVSDKEAREMINENEKLKEIAFKDTLTGLYNRNKYEEDIKVVPIKKLVAVSVDANNLKYMNDNFGHEAGDKLLKGIAEDLKKTLQIDNIYRTGGDEFVCFFLNESMNIVQERLHTFEEELNKRNSPDDDLVFSAAYGFASFIKGDSLESMQKRADENMYAMKKAYKEANPKYDMRRNRSSAVVTPPANAKNPNKSAVKVVPKKKKSKRKVKTPIKQANVLPSITPQARPDLEEISTADFLPSHTFNNQYRVGEVDKSYISMKERLREIQSETNEDEVIQMLDEINADKNFVIMICIVTKNLDTLFLIRDPQKFFEVCEKLDNEISVSYIYVLYKTRGIKYYMQKPDEILIQNIFSDIAKLFQENSVVTSSMVAKVNNIGIFKKIYIN